MNTFVSYLIRCVQLLGCTSGVSVEIMWSSGVNSTPLNPFVHRHSERFVWNVESFCEKLQMADVGLYNMERIEEYDDDGDGYEPAQYDLIQECGHTRALVHGLGNKPASKQCGNQSTNGY